MRVVGHGWRARGWAGPGLLGGRRDLGWGGVDMRCGRGGVFGKLRPRRGRNYCGLKRGVMKRGVAEVAQTPCSSPKAERQAGDRRV